MRLLRDIQIVAVHVDANAQAAESIQREAQIADRGILDADAIAHHGSHTDKRTYLYHVGQYGVGCAMQRRNALDNEQVTGHACNLCAHAVEQAAQLLDIGFAGSIVNGCGALRRHSGHDNVGGSGDRSLIQQHIAPLQLLGLQLIGVTLRVFHEGGTQRFKSQEVGI